MNADSPPMIADPEIARGVSDLMLEPLYLQHPDLKPRNRDQS